MSDQNTVTITQVQQDFALVAQLAKEKGKVVITKGDQPRYVLVDLEEAPVLDMTDDEKIDLVAARVLKRYKQAFLELAK